VRTVAADGLIYGRLHVSATGRQFRHVAGAEVRGDLDRLLRRHDLHRHRARRIRRDIADDLACSPIHGHVVVLTSYVVGSDRHPQRTFIRPLVFAVLAPTEPVGQLDVGQQVTDTPISCAKLSRHPPE
jgi:hypothetical protein